MAFRMTVVVALALSFVTAASCANADTDAPSRVDDSKVASETAVLEASVKAGLGVSQLQAALKDTELTVLKLSKLIGTAVEQSLRRHSNKDVFDWYELSDEVLRTYRTGELPAIVSSVLTTQPWAQHFAEQIIAWRFDSGWLTLEASRQTEGWWLNLVIRGAGEIQVVSGAGGDKNGRWTSYTVGRDWICLMRKISYETDPRTLNACVCTAKSDSCGLLPAIAGHQGLTPIVQGKPGSALARNEAAVTLPLN